MPLGRREGIGRGYNMSPKKKRESRYWPLERRKGITRIGRHGYNMSGMRRSKFPSDTLLRSS
jgi:hypothetical protein